MYRLLKRWGIPLLSPRRPDITIIRLIEYLKNWKTYSGLEKSGSIKLLDTQPELFDNSKTTLFDYHYVYQSTWALEQIQINSPYFHVDIGSQIQFVASVAVFVPTIFLDIRPVYSKIKGMTSIAGNILNSPFTDGTIASISCLHVAEHIGLGRYGDQINPKGTELACKELKRILSAGGNLYFSVPVGKPKIRFNAHRIHSIKQILDYFDGLKLIHLSAVMDNGDFVLNPDLSELDSQEYACGLFWFRK